MGLSEPVKDVAELSESPFFAEHKKLCRCDESDDRDGEEVGNAVSALSREEGGAVDDDDADDGDESDGDYEDDFWNVVNLREVDAVVRSMPATQPEVQSSLTFPIVVCVGDSTSRSCTR